VRTATEVLIEHETAVKARENAATARLEAYLAGLPPIEHANDQNRAQRLREKLQKQNPSVYFSGIACDRCRTELVYNREHRHLDHNLRVHSCPGCGETYTLPAYPERVWSTPPEPEPPKTAFDRDFDGKMKSPEFARAYTEVQAEIDAVDQEVRHCQSPEEAEHVLQQYRLRRFPVLEPESVAGIDDLDLDLVQR
jgi:ribosomal protein S27E